MTGVLIRRGKRDTQGKHSHAVMEAETGVIPLLMQAKERHGSLANFQKLKVTMQESPSCCKFHREAGPANTLSLNFLAPKQRLQTTVVLNHPVSDILIHHPIKLIQIGKRFKGLTVSVIILALFLALRESLSITCKGPLPDDSGLNPL